MGSNVAFSDLNETSSDLPALFNFPLLILAWINPSGEKLIWRFVNLEFSVCWERNSTGLSSCAEKMLSL